MSRIPNKLVSRVTHYQIKIIIFATKVKIVPINCEGILNNYLPSSISQVIKYCNPPKSEISKALSPRPHQHFLWWSIAKSWKLGATPTRLRGFPNGYISPGFTGHIGNQLYFNITYTPIVHYSTFILVAIGFPTKDCDSPQYTE
jgi:hypothetical protein